MKRAAPLAIGHRETFPARADPARLSAALAALFPGGVHAAELTQPVTAASLSGAERQCVSRCRDKRIIDFAAGRVCARHALAALGVGDFDLLVAADRQPLWPAALVGSITHTDGYSAAVVAERTTVRSLGIDTELISAVTADIWPRICAPEELERLRQQPVEEQARTAALIFVAKEAFFKAQFPLAREWFKFHEVIVAGDDGQSSSGSFRVTPQRSSRLDDYLTAARGRRALEGRFRRHDGFVTAGMAVGVA